MYETREYVVLYRNDALMRPEEPPFGFVCYAEDTNHAEEQCENAYPDCSVVWVYEVNPQDSYKAALADYWSSGLEDENVSP